jgi:hypothetical protein
MARFAALLILLSQVLLLWVAWEPTGTTAIWFVFVGHPMLGAGCVLALWALSRRLRREREANSPS